MQKATTHAPSETRNPRVLPVAVFRGKLRELPWGHVPETDAQIVQMTADALVEVESSRAAVEFIARVAHQLTGQRYASTKRNCDLVTVALATKPPTIVQMLPTRDSVVALKSDGTMWEFTREGWKSLPKLP